MSGELSGKMAGKRPTNRTEHKVEVDRAVPATEQLLATELLRASLDRLLAIARKFQFVEDDGVKGVLRESLIDSFIEPLLMPPFRAGTGVVVDSRGNQSGQCDIIIWDDGIFRPLYSARGAGIFFVEAVVAVIEIKSTLRRGAYSQAIQRSREFKNMAILRPPAPDLPSGYWGAEPGIMPINMLFGFRSDTKGPERPRAEATARRERVHLHDYLQAVVVPGKEAWVFQEGAATPFRPATQTRYHEVLMPFAALFNSLKEVSRKRGHPRLGAHIVPYVAE